MVLEKIKEKAEEFRDKIENKSVKDKSIEVEPDFFESQRIQCLTLREMAEEKIRLWEEKKTLELKEKHDSEMQSLCKQITKAISDLQEQQKQEISLAKNSIDPKLTNIIHICNNFLLKLDKMEEKDGNNQKN